MLAWVADLWGVVLIAFLCASTGGATSPFALIYFFAIGHAAAFQPRARFLLVSFAGLVAFLTPLAYSHVTTNFGAIAAVGAVLALLVTTVVHGALERMREQRWRLEFLIAATARLDTSLDPRQTLREIGRTAIPQLAEICLIDLIDADRSITTSIAAAGDAALAERLEGIRGANPPELRAGDPIARSLGAKASCLLDDLAEPSAHRWTAGTEAEEQLLGQAGCRAGVVLPMVARGRLLGAISFLHPSRLDPGTIALLEDLTGRASMAFDNARLYAERAHVARTLRRSLMPSALPATPGLELASFFQPMGAGNEVGGDFFDVFGAGAGGCWLVVGDVCGKGAEAAVLTGFLRHTTVAYAGEGARPAHVLARVNQAMLDHDFDGRFATAILAHLVFGGSQVEVTIAAAGHPPALLARAGGAAEELGGCGTLLGVFPEPDIAETSTTLAPGDVLVLHTDGLSDAHAPERILTEREMLDQLARTPPRTAREAIDALFELVDLERGARDDIAILAARMKRPGEV
jgi:Stage II sporulation protein E (SpoIIE)/GAF domain